MAVTGGAIRADKSWWYLVDYVWHRGRWICKDTDMDIDLVAENAEGETVSLKRLRCNEATILL